MPRAVKLRIRDLLAPGETVHVARATIDPRYHAAQHDHDFYELFWVTNGGAWHTINGQRHRLVPDSAWFIRPDDVHGFHATGRSVAAFINVALPAPAVDALRDRYTNQDGDAWPWSERHAATPIALSGGLTRALTTVAMALANRKQKAVARDRFLLTVLDELALDQRADPAAEARQSDPAATPAMTEPMPQWLRDAVEHLKTDTDALRDGVGALSEQSHRCREHVARTLRACAGCTPTQLVNRMRLEQAAHALSMSDRAITDIAGDVGLDNLSHFYRMFRERFGTTPRRYRMRQRRVVGGG